jgi:hypothetical protein
MGRAGKETQDALQLVAGLSMDILMLDIVVIVILAVEIIAEVGVLESVGVCWVTISSWLELMEFVSCIQRIADESG